MMNARQQRLLVVALVVPFALLASCGGGGGSKTVPDDQDLQPASAPSGWEGAKLDLVSLAAPADWIKADSTTAEKDITVTTWSTEPVDGRSSAGVEVREIPDPQYSAEEAAEGLAVNAMATMKGGRPAPEEITWPNATDARVFTNEITAGPTPESTQTYVSNTFVADLADGSQVQVLVVTLKGEDDDLGTQLLSTIELKEVEE